MTVTVAARLVGLCVALTTLSVATPAAHAQNAVRDADRFRSRQSWAFELKMGPYYPDIDSEFAGTDKAPHKQYFGTSKRLMGQVAIDYQFFRGFGSLGVGATLGYGRETAHAFRETIAGISDARSADETRLSLFPTALSVVYRLDAAARRWHLPVVPYGKLGLSYVMWSISDGNGTTAKSDSPPGNGRGGTSGIYAALGVSLLLDVFDPGAARELDADVGVNHTYLFLEAARFDQSGLGTKNVLKVGDTTWFAGFMFEF